MNALIFLSLFTSSIYASLLSIQPVPDEGIYFASQHITIEEDQVFLRLLSFDGNKLWQKEITTVRNDAAAVSICPAQDGGILTATAYGTGYTNILVTKWNSSGEELNTDTIAFECYDTPYQLTSFDEGYLLLWDSWSDERGLHLALIDSSGNIVNTSFVIPTMHPAPSALATDENSFIVVASPSVLDEQTSLVKYSGFESIVWSQVSNLEEELYLFTLVDLLIENSGKFNVIWETLEFTGKINQNVITQHSADGAVEQYYNSPLIEYSEAVLVKLLPYNKIILIEQAEDSSSFQIVKTDIQGNELNRTSVDYNFLPVTIDCLADSGFLVTGKTADSGELIRVTDTGEVLWSFSL